uniref:BTB domain-containing protein n=1 Tax=Panagrolaimus davidi TaxID=227884 RepID=A0A914PBI7_9BILA
MMKIIILQKEMEISLISKTVIKIDENHEFTVAPIKYTNFCYCHIKNIKGDFEITNIKKVVADGKDKKSRNQIIYNIENGMFKCLEASKNVITLLFTIFYDDVKKNVNVGLYRLKKLLQKKTTKNDEDKSKPALAVNSKWYEIMSNNEYSDVTFISSDNIQIKSHRCVLSKHSKILSTIFKSRKSPIKINAEEFKGEIIQAAIDFLYDKTDSIKGKEVDVFKFAERYCIRDVTNL